MTFKEMKAEEWLQGIEGDECVIITDREERKQAYIAGLIEEREQLEQAKNIIRELIKYVSDSKWYVQNGYVELQNKLVTRAKQFLN